MVKNKIKIAFTYSSPHVYTGSGYTLYHLLNYLNDLPHVEIRLVCQSPYLREGACMHQINTNYIIDRPNLPKYGKRYTKWLYWLLIPKMLKNSLKSFENWNPDAVVGIFPDEYFTWLGYLLSKKLNVPFFPWFHNSYIENRKGLGVVLGKKIQYRIFTHAKKIFTMSDGLNNYYKEAYPGFTHKFMTLQHGYPLAEKKILFQDERIKNGKIKIAFVGNLSLSYLEASERLFRIAEKNRNLQIHIFSNTSLQTFKNLSKGNPDIVYYGFIKDDNYFEQEIAACSLCFIPLGLSGPISTIEYQTIFPTRLITLLRQGAPILVHAPANSFLAAFIKRYNCGWVASEPDDASLEKIIESIILEKNEISLKKKNAIKASSYFDVKNVAKQLLRQINQSDEVE